MVTAIVFLLILGFLVFVHELGHFVVARRNGIKASEFGFGFPPRVIGIQFLYDDEKRKKKNKKKGFRIIRGSKDGDDEQEKIDIKEANLQGLYGGTVYSLNWFPIGGFVKIKGENGEGKNDKESFASKSAWTRIKVLVAGVAMNFIFAWIFFSIGFMLGTPQEVVNDKSPNSKIMITAVEKNSPAEKMGIIDGDIILTMQTNDGKNTQIRTVKNLQDYVAQFKGREMTLNIKRNGNSIILTGTPRMEVSENEGLLGIALAQVETIKYPFFSAFGKGFVETKDAVVMTYDFLFKIFSGDKVAMSGVGSIIEVAHVTNKIIPMGLAAVIRLVAIFSINLAVLNILPIPALDGGRILFILIEKIKGSPVNQKVEQAFHGTGLMLLMLLMLFLAGRDLMRIFG
jgi:regulator of sigma E protease